MPKYAKIGSAIARRREAPGKSHVCIRIINSAFFLWFASAIALSTGGAFFTTRQKCIEDSDRIELEDLRIRQELQLRRTLISEALKRSTTVSDLKEGLTKIPFLFTEFKDKSVSELLSRRTEFYQRARRLPGFDYEHADPDTEPLDSLSIALLMQPEMTNDQLSYLKQSISNEQEKRYNSSNGSLYIAPNCSAKNIWTQLFNSDNKVMGLFVSIRLRGLIKDEATGKFVPMSAEMQRQVYGPDATIFTPDQLLKQIDPNDPMPLPSVPSTR